MRVLESGGNTGIQNPSLPQTPSPSRQSQIPDPDSTALETPTPRAARVTTPRVARTPTPRTPRVARTPAPAPAPRKATPVPAVEGGSRRRRGSSIASSGGSSIFEESLASLPAKRARTLHWKVREADEATGGSKSEDEEEI
ncbi:hypothetical protein EG328_002906 [Venturia inaequalis]|uniref:Uncharacterized protein n=1 Tax=Venturia inaequalis TaxID=5025 RepID=A0A8H3U1V8_VENIN|nr:hypothetical protein EG328_002906 [Venturia inaequalis]